LTRIFVPVDAVARALGADQIAAALLEQLRAGAAREAQVTVVRTGSRGLFWLEPMIEVETPAGRIAYGPVAAADIPELLADGLLAGTAERLRLGVAENIPFLARQTRLTFARCGVIDPLSLDDYRDHGGMAGLEKARAIGPAATIEVVMASGLRGRGGAGFPTGIKWKTTAEAPVGGNARAGVITGSPRVIPGEGRGPTTLPPRQQKVVGPHAEHGDDTGRAGDDTGRRAGADHSQQKYIVCNADEGDSGTYADRMLMEGDPFSVIEGMAIAGLAVGASKGFVYTRSEYPQAIATFNQALAIARQAGILGGDFDIEQRVGAGAYVCGEETSLLESLEGRRGQVRSKPPLPAHKGLFGCPTVVNNLVTLATVPMILQTGAAAYQAMGTGRSRGTMPIQLAGNIRYGGLFEVGFGVTLKELIFDIGGGTLSGRPVRAVQVGGPLGAYFPPSLFDTPFDYEAFAARDGLIGHGGVVVFDDTVDMAHQARFAMEFCAAESCGKCTPCRIGSVRGMETVNKIIAGQSVDANLELLRDLCHTLKFGSLCALGGFIPYPVLSAMNYFPEDFRQDHPVAAE
jgi:formate dehydrogenase iron-sulfur subunit